MTDASRWTRTRVSELGFRYGKALSENERVVGGRWPVIGSAGRMAATNSTLYDGPMIVIGRKGHAGRVHLEMHGGWPIDTTFFLPVPATFDPAYLSHVLSVAGLENMDSSTATPSLRREDLEAVEFLAPPLHDQERIAGALAVKLDRIDAALSGLAQAELNLAALVRSTIDDVFEGRAIDEEWPIRSLEELASPERRAITDGPFGSNLASKHYVTQGPRVIRLQNIGDGYFKSADAHISESHYESLSSHQVRTGDVVIASLGDEIPRATLIPDGVAPAIVKADCIRVRPRDARTGAWIVAATRSSEAKRWAASRMHGMGRQRLGMKGVRALPIRMPADAKQVDEILAHIRDLDGHASRTRAQIQATRHRAFSLRRAVVTAAVTPEADDVMQLKPRTPDGNARGDFQ